MVLLFDPAPPSLQWCKVHGGKLSGGTYEFGHQSDELVRDHIGGLEAVRTVGYVLHHGGEEIDRPVSLMTRDSLKSLERCMRFQPEYNEVTLKAAEFWMSRLPDVRHLLLCDTAYFAKLPPEASDYAVPGKLREDGIRRYGGFGLCHQWAWEHSELFLGHSVRRVISVYLGDHSNVAAIADGSPVDTTIGFTPVEGILSSGGCGDIDPTIVFELHSTGMSLREITRVLSRESGFTGLLGRECGFTDITPGWDEPAISAVREVLCHSLKKSIGAFLSVLGGVDAVVFLCEDPPQSMRLITALCHSLEFLGADRRPAPEKQGGVWNMVHDRSNVPILCLTYDKWKIIAEAAHNFTLKER